jgi:hypothetical protein
MEAWLGAHAIKAAVRPAWADAPPAAESEAAPESSDEPAPKSQSGRRARTAEVLRQTLLELAEGLGPRDLETVVGFAEFLKTRRAARGFAHHHEHMMQERASGPGSSPPPKKEKDGEDL